MGMFDYINFVVECLNCEEIIVGFQSKDGPCDLELLNFWEVENFYSSCENCKTHLEYNLKVKRPYIPIENYELTITGGD